jgi:SAM-dependent methyltransferase
MLKSSSALAPRLLANWLRRVPAARQVAKTLVEPLAAAQPEKFVPAQDEWVRSHYYTVPDDTDAFCGPIFADARVLNVGCGEMLTDFGLLRLGPKSITGLDVAPRPADHFEQLAAKLTANGIYVSDEDRRKIDFVQYDGENFPFPDGHFDAVFSWSAFEHVANVPRVLAEIRRVLKPAGHAFIQVYPWFHNRQGSHLTDWIKEPYFQLRRPGEWVRAELEKQAVARPAERDFMLGHMWPEYRSLNKFSARDFYAAVRLAGFTVLKAKLVTYEQDLSEAPADIDFADLMIFGTLMLLRK